MKQSVLAVALLLVMPHAFAQDSPPPPPPACDEGSGEANSLSVTEVLRVVNAAAASLDSDAMTIAVVDRAGSVLALFRKSGANPANDDIAVGLARTGAFFSHNQAPLSSRTVRFLSGIHFPPGIVNTPNAPLYGIENTNRGCDLNIIFNVGKAVPPARSVNGAPCNSKNASGCGPGIVTGKVQPNDADPNAVLAGGIPLYRLNPALITGESFSGGQLVAGVGVIGSGDTQLDEYAAVTGVFAAGAPLPSYPLPEPQNVYIDGVRLPFLGPDQRLRFNNAGLPNGLEQLKGVRAGNANGTYVVLPRDGRCASNGYLAGPEAGSRISAAEVDTIVQTAVAAAKRTRAAIRLPLNRYTRMVIAVADVDGTVLALYRMPDATVFSIDVSVAKSRNVVYFSTDAHDLPGVSSGTAVTNRTIGFGAQPLYPPGIDSRAFGVRPGPFFPLFLQDLARPCSQGSQPANPNQNGIVFFPGATPLYRGTTLVGGLGVSGDGVEQDDYVTVSAAGMFLPPHNIWADRLSIDRARLPMFKFPRHPEGVSECGGKACD